MAQFSLIFSLIRPYRRRLIPAVLLTTLFTVGTLLPPLAMRFLIDHVIVGKQWQLLAATVSLVAFIPIWNAFVAVLFRILIGALAQRLVADLRTALYRHVLSLTMQFHSRIGAGPIMSRLMTDVGLVQNMITGDTLSIVSNLVALIFCVGMAFDINWMLAIVLLVMVSLYAFNYHKFALRIRQANLDLREIMDMVTGQLQERLAGVRLVKTYCRERDETASFLRSTNRALECGMNSQILSISLSATARLIGGYGSTIIWCGCAWFILDPKLSVSIIHRPMTFGDLQAMNAYVWGAVTPAVNLTMVANVLIQAMASLDRIAELFHETSDIQEKPEARDLPEPVSGELRFDQVTFGYKPDELLFENLDLHLPAGKMIALVGRTGCGKTSITSLLMRLWDVQGGKITIDGTDVRDLRLRSLRNHVGVVPQEPILFESTVRHNIAYCKPDAEIEEIMEAARTAQIHDYIETLPNGYDTWIGKDGVHPSVGQKQRIAIARAILTRPAVLIMDEATSSLDSESETAIQEALRIVLHNRTSVVVAHRLSTIVEADCIVAMDSGHVVEMGTHDQLMSIESGYYRGLYEELKGQHEEDAS